VIAVDPSRVNLRTIIERVNRLVLLVTRDRFD